MPLNPDTPPVDIVAAAHERHVVVVGGGIAGLVAALEFAKVGIRVTVLEASAQLGGVIGRVDLDGVLMDAGATQLPSSAKAVRDLVTELGLGDDIVTATQDALWVASANGSAAPLPLPSVLGIPANPWADDVRRIIGWGGAWRAYLDRLRPVLTIGSEKRLDHLVRSRMGDKVADRLVAPLTRGRFGMLATDVDVDVAAPGLNQALTRTGSLSGAVGQLTDDVKRLPAWSIRGGLFRLVDALAERLDVLGAEVRYDTRVIGLAQHDGGWAVEVAPDADAAAPDADPHAAPTPIRADAVIVATGGAAAQRLLPALAASVSPSKLQPVPETAGETCSLGDPVKSRETADGGGEADGSAHRVDVVTLRVSARQLDTAPRGAGVVTALDRPGAVAVEHLSAVWPWIREDAGHVVRVVFGAAGFPPATENLDDAAAISLARGEAAELLGVPEQDMQVVAGTRTVHWQEVTASALGHEERSQTIRKAAANKVPHLAVVGSWVSGSGVTPVVADATVEAERMRRSLLWG